MIQYTFPPGRQPESEADSIALGFITTKTDAVLLRIESSTTQDYMELEIVRVLYSTYLYCIRRNMSLLLIHIFFFFETRRWKVTFSWYTTLVRTICRWAKLAPKSTITPITSYGFNVSAATPHYNWTITMFKPCIHKVSNNSLCFHSYTIIITI